MSTSSSPSLPDQRLAAGAARPARRYAGHFAPETALGLLPDSYSRLAEHARVRTHLVVLAERLTAERLDGRGPGRRLPQAGHRGSRPGRRHRDHDGMR
ncbi:three-helix bundle dimerization domain-containing protein [Streptomyces sp. HUAS TT3]|uniref:three-helix bundle dimerization domain-containing protein n=1 Tax=Streptomyces sp. HUAS TT3 TaxID=3447510 RepID=UPI003F65F279